jgi:hypothetical protein
VADPIGGPQRAYVETAAEIDHLVARLAVLGGPVLGGPVLGGPVLGGPVLGGPLLPGQA